MEGITSPPVAQSNNGVFNPFLISILGIVVTITTIGLYHFILVKYCMRRIAAAATTTSPQTAATGVDEKILQNIPIFTITYLERRLFQSNQEECVVCLGELEDGDSVRILPNCSHAFHVPCIDAWFSTHVTCPLCRSLITADNPNTTPCRSTDSSDLEISNIGTSNSSGDTETQPRVQSSGLLRHCVSLALPPAGERRQTPARLKRSLSMDQSFVLINLQIDNRTSNSSSSRGELTTSDPHITRSLNHFDRVSSKLRRSFSRLRLGKGSDHAPILPY